ncbi:MAG: flippase [Acidimicrobiia bacterium]
MSATAGVGPPAASPQPPDVDDAAASSASSHTAPVDTASQVRGSSMLLVGRVSTMAINLGVQATVVRALSRTEYGAFAYALSLVQSLAVFLTLGIDRAMPRFLAHYDERGDIGRLVGVLIVQLSTIASIGSFGVIGVIGLQGWLTDTVIGDPLIVATLVILAVLAPIQALDDLAVSIFAVYARPRSIFIRRYILEPAARLAVVALLAAMQAGPRFLALGYVATGAAGVLLYASMLLPLLRRRGVLPLPRGVRPVLPWKEVLGYSLPLMSSDLLYAVLNTTDVILIRRHAGTDAVSAYRAIQPFAKMNQFVMTSFALLFTPALARLLVRGDRRAVGDLYWNTAAWLAVLTFPVFTLTFSLGGSLSTAVLGSEYADAGIYLTLLSAGYYFNAALGFNGLTVKTAGRVRYTVVISFVALGCNLAMNLVLIPRYGALGAAIANLATLAFHNVLKQVGLQLGTGVELFRRDMAGIYAAIVAHTVALLLVQSWLDPPFPVGVGLAGVASLSVLLFARRRLDLSATFPELSRLPLVGSLLQGGR